MLIFFDFDDVLFNTKEFKKDYFSLFKKNGISRRVFEECYYDSLDKNEIKIYSPINHINRICQKEKVDISKIRIEIINFIRDTSHYVFDDVNLILNKDLKDKMYIVSFSKTNFQKSKIFNSGLVDYFKSVKIINKLKGSEVQKIMKKESHQIAYFIDDRINQIDDVKLINPQVKTILLRRKEGRYLDRRSENCDFVAKNIKDILKIINLSQINDKNKNKK